MKRLLVGALVVVFGLAGVAHADSIIDTSDADGTVASLGPMVIYGQSMVAGGDTLTDVTFFVGHDGGSDAIFNFLITGARADLGTTLGWAPDLGDIRYDGGAVDVSAGSAIGEVSFSPNLAVTANELLFLVFDGFSYPETSAGNPGQTRFSFNITGDAYSPGEFLYVGQSNHSAETSLADFNSRSWENLGGRDLAFIAEFSVVPEPSTLALLALGLTGLAWRRRRGLAGERRER